MHPANRYTASALSLLLLAAAAPAAPVNLPNGTKIERVDFERHVIGLLGRLGCNAGACHGSFQGKGGLYMSLFGYNPEKDYLSFTREGLGRRINFVDPDQSLLLLKATGQVIHGGGKRFDKNSWQYRVFREWIVAGAPWQKGSGTVERMDVTPHEHRFAKPGQQHQLLTVVKFADGTIEDLTCFSDFRVNDDYVAEVSRDGQLSGIRPGDTAVVVSYRGNVRAVRALVPVEPAKGFVYPKVPEAGYIDREVFAKLRSLNIVPSGLSSDGEFIRRIYIDTIGTLPGADEVRAFLADNDPNKRAKLIDRLLADPMHAALWATKFCDITGNSVDALDQSNNLRSKWSKMWHDWFRARVAKNLPYDEIVQGVLCATTAEELPMNDWIDREVKLVEEAQKGFEAPYAERKSLDLFWRKRGATLEQRAEHAAAAFLGVRVECAQCHKHPFDRWTQADYRSFANIFAGLRVGSSPEAKKAIDSANRNRAMTKAKEKIKQVYYDAKGARQLTDPETNRPLTPKALGGPQIQLQDDPRLPLFEWLRSKDNPYFARSFVNRVWGHYFGVGLVDPVDDFSIANPPSNAKLLDALAQDFIEHKFDIRHIERTILRSRTYQLASTPNASNLHDRNNFARSYPRRMMAEVVVDVVNAALGSTENFGNDVPKGVRAIEVAPNRVQSTSVNYVFQIFGRPPRTSTCDCERAMEPALPQTLFLMTDSTVIGKITGGRLKGLLADKEKSDAEVLDDIFLATLCRLPRDQEKAEALAHVDKKGRQPGFTDVTWALINTREFILNH